MIDLPQDDKKMMGFSLPSFLQMLESERASCTLTVTSAESSGKFFFQEGKLIDAGYQDKAGLHAVHALLALKNPTFNVGQPQDRMERITHPLARILLHSDGKDQQNLPNETIAVKGVPLFRKLITKIIASPSIKHYYLLDRKGKTIVRSSENQQRCNFIFYSIMSSLQVRKSLGVRGPQHIQIIMEDDEVLLILPGAGIIIGLLLSAKASIPDIISKIRTTLRSPAKKEK